MKVRTLQLDPPFRPDRNLVTSVYPQADHLPALSVADNRSPVFESVVKVQGTPAVTRTGGPVSGLRAALLRRAEVAQLNHNMADAAMRRRLERW